MAFVQSVVSLKIELARQRCLALKDELRSLETKTYPSKACRILLSFVESATESIVTHLKQEEELPDKDLLTEEERDDRVHRVTKLIPLLHIVLGFIEGSDIASAPSSLVAQLRRLAESVLPSSDVVVSARSELNYSIQEIGKEVRGLFEQTPLNKCCSILPDFFFVVTVPRVESDEVLLHCILAHELGHGLYERFGLAGKLLPKVQISQDMVKGFADEIISQIQKGGQQPPPLLEVEMRGMITQEVTGRITNWMQELCSDLFGLLLFGPAYFCAFVYFSLAFLHLDQDSRSHPPPRLRLKVMSKAIEKLYPNDVFKEAVRDFLGLWFSVAQKPMKFRDRFTRIAVQSIDTADVFNSIVTETSSCLNANQTYTSTRYASDVNQFAPLIVNIVPPGELGTLGNASSAQMASILNAGWEVLISDLEKFRGNLPREEAASPHLVRKKLQKVLLKALEIAETRTSWKEVRLALGIRKN